MPKTEEPELPCCGFPAEVTHRVGDRAYVCPMCNISWVIHADLITEVMYTVQPMSTTTAAILRSARRSHEQGV
jgi:hypothetical protein